MQLKGESGIALFRREGRRVHLTQDLALLSPRDGAQRGSQVSFTFTEGHAAMQALIDRNMIAAAYIHEQIMSKRLLDTPRVRT